MKKTYKNYIFDLYGTLVDIHTNESKGYLWEKMALFYSMNGASYEANELKNSYKNLCRLEEKKQCDEIFKLDNPENSGRREIKAELEINIDYVFARLYMDKDINPSCELIQNTETMFRTISIEYIKLYPGTAELLSKLKAMGKKVYLLSNAQHSFTIPELYKLGIGDMFDAIYISSKLKFKKPGKRFFDSLIKGEKLDVGESLMIGNDIECDIEGAKKIGMDTFYINSNLSPKKDATKSVEATYSSSMGNAYTELLKL